MPQHSRPGVHLPVTAVGRVLEALGQRDFLGDPQPCPAESGKPNMLAPLPEVLFRVLIRRSRPVVAASRVNRRDEQRCEPSAHLLSPLRFAVGRRRVRGVRGAAMPGLVAPQIAVLVTALRPFVALPGYGELPPNLLEGDSTANLLEGNSTTAPDLLGCGQPDPVGTLLQANLIQLGVPQAAWAVVAPVGQRMQRLAEPPYQPELRLLQRLRVL